MKYKYFALLLCAGLVAGCANRYVIKMTDGTMVTSENKPRLVNGYFQYKDASGRQMAIPSGRVREVSPASMADDKDSRIFSPQTRPAR